MWIEKPEVPHWSIIFGRIFWSNSLVAISLMCGFLTGGISIFAILWWNGFLVGRLLNVPIYRLGEILGHLWGHGIFELTAFFLFGTIGLNITINILNFFADKEYLFDRILLTRMFILGCIFLFIAACVETYSILYL